MEENVRSLDESIILENLFVSIMPKMKHNQDREFYKFVRDIVSKNYTQVAMSVREVCVVNLVLLCHRHHGGRAQRGGHRPEQGKPAHRRCSGPVRAERRGSTQRCAAGHCHGFYYVGEAERGVGSVSM